MSANTEAVLFDLTGTLVNLSLEDDKSWVISDDTLDLLRALKQQGMSPQLVTLSSPGKVNSILQELPELQVLLDVIHTDTDSAGRVELALRLGAPIVDDDYLPGRYANVSPYYISSLDSESDLESTVEPISWAGRVAIALFD